MPSSTHGTAWRVPRATPQGYFVGSVDTPGTRQKLQDGRGVGKEKKFGVTQQKEAGSSKSEGSSQDPPVMGH